MAERILRSQKSEIYKYHLQDIIASELIGDVAKLIQDISELFLSWQKIQPNNWQIHLSCQQTQPSCFAPVVTAEIEIFQQQDRNQSHL